MKTGARQRWLVLVALLTLALTAAAWVRETENPEAQAIVEAPARDERATGVAAATPAADHVALEKLQKHRLDATEADPFAPRSWSKSAPPRAAAQPVAPAPPPPVASAPPPPPSAPPLPFIYLGRIAGEEANAVFLAHGERNLIVRQGDEIDAVYRVERVAGNAVTLTHLPTGIQQSLAIRGNP